MSNHSLGYAVLQSSLYIDYFFFFCFLGPQLPHMDVPRLGVESELQLPAYITATATATWDPSYVCDPHHSSWQHQIPDPLREARDLAHILMYASQTRFCCATRGTPFFLDIDC